jgi:cell division protein FtsL
MLKLLLCILCAILITGSLLHLKHQRMEINHKINQSHKRLQNLQIELWNQQLQVAIYTAPNAIENTVGSHHLDLVPSNPMLLGPAVAGPLESDAE